MPKLYKHAANHVQNQSRAVPFAGAGERRGRTPEPQFAAPPVATRNGLARPPRIGAPRACVLTNAFSPENSGRTEKENGIKRVFSLSALGRGPACLAEIR